MSPGFRAQAQAPAHFSSSSILCRSLAGTHRRQHRLQGRRVQLPDPAAGLRPQVPQPLLDTRTEDRPRRTVGMREVDLRSAAAAVLQPALGRDGNEPIEQLWALG